MTTWQLFIQALGYLMLFDLCVVVLGAAWLLHEERREEREVKQLERMYARRGW